MSRPCLTGSTFRDPVGSLELREDAAYRRLEKHKAGDLLRFVASPLYSRLVLKREMVASEVQTIDEGFGDTTVLRHPLVFFRSYPWEWPPRLWLAAAELTLELCEDLIRSNWILKDATPLNILFEGAKPIFVDVASVERLKKGLSLWLAYAQFVRTFVLPLLAHAELGWPLQTSQLRRDGLDPQDLYSSLSIYSRLRQPALTSVSLPIWLSRMNNGSETLRSKVAPGALDEDIAKQVLIGRLKSLKKQIRRCSSSTLKSTWSEYEFDAHHYCPEDKRCKQSFVQTVLHETGAKRVLDIGCNTGTFSKLAADLGAEVVAIDSDVSAVDRLASECVVSGAKILPLCIDLAHPSPAIGWLNQEWASFLERSRECFDTVLLLAAIHHLLISSQIPMHFVASLCHELTTCSLVIEWVPASDPKFQELVRGRNELYAHLNEESFRSAFLYHFRLETEQALINGRKLFHMRRK